MRQRDGGSGDARRASLALLLGLALLGACGSDETGADRVSEEAQAASGGSVGSVGFAEMDAAAQGAPALPGSVAQAPRMLVRTGHATIEVEVLDPAVQSVRRIAERAGGYVSNVGIAGGRDQMRSASLTIRIPATRFDETIASLDSLGEVESVHVDSEDVGEQYADLELRLASSRRLEQRLLELLDDRTGSLEDVLAVERELARVREQIERMDASLRGLRDRVDMSTITLSLHEPEPLFSTRGGENVISRSFRQAGRNFINFVAGVIASLGVILPLALIAAFLWWLWRRRRRRRNRATDRD